MMSNDPLHGGLCTYLLWDIFLLQRFLVCVSIVDFWFAVILRFSCKSLYVYEIVLSCCSLNCKFISTVLAFVLTSSHDFWFWWYNCAWMISYLYCIYIFTGEPCHLWNFCFLLLSFFSAYRSSFSICCKAGLVVLNSLSFCFFVKLSISPSSLNESIAW